MQHVIDASVVIKWYISEPDSDAATALLDSEEDFLAPDLLFVECASIVAKLVRRGKLTAERAHAIIAKVVEGPFTTVTNVQITDDALRIA